MLFFRYLFVVLTLVATAVSCYWGWQCALAVPFTGRYPIIALVCTCWVWFLNHLYFGDQDVRLDPEGRFAWIADTLLIPVSWICLVLGVLTALNAWLGDGFLSDSAYTAVAMFTWAGQFRLTWSILFAPPIPQPETKVSRLTPE